MKKLKVNKLFNGYVTVRSPVVANCLATNQCLVVAYNGKEMTLTPKQLLEKKEQFNKKVYTSKYNRQKYELYDYKFTPANTEQLELAI